MNLYQIVSQFNLFPTVIVLWCGLKRVSDKCSLHISQQKININYMYIFAYLFSNKCTLHKSPYLLFYSELPADTSYNKDSSTIQQSMLLAEAHHNSELNMMATHGCLDMDILSHQVIAKQRRITIMHSIEPWCRHVCLLVLRTFTQHVNVANIMKPFACWIWTFSHNK